MPSLPFRSLIAAVLGASLSCASSVSVAADPQQVYPPDSMGARLAACTACHGAQGKAGPDGYYPRIAGKPADYLFNQLRHFRDGRRQYPPMQGLLENLSDDYLKTIAGWFADQHPPYEASAASRASAATLERGKTLAMTGDPSRKVPACAACHGSALTGVLPAIPGLLGVPHDYISSQFGAWTNGLRKASAPDCMADIARRMTPDDISAVAAWLSQQPAGEGLPAASLPAPLPLACGSQATTGGAS
ncbi:c-type cytochrome [Pigmentiphaga litoralis]|uniref:c-type cytochrome n=1 Tax=Pigmentiphaga litoralis TaxID=516702 RepID=UPI003B429811